jgi:outer membrane protein assembly factor BamB
MVRSGSKVSILLAITLNLLFSSFVLVSGCSSPKSNIPSEIGDYQHDWPTANCAYDNTRATTDSLISRDNVPTLGLAWSIDITGIGEWGGMASNPIILGDKVYCQDLKSNTYAIDLKSGELLWKKEYNLDSFGPNGPAIGWDKLFVPKGHYEVAALDLENGNELWSTRLSDIETLGIDIQLTAFNEMVYVSTVPGTSNADFYTGGNVGIIYALDQETGAVSWQFSTVDSEDVWGNPGINSGGGAWFPPAIDTGTGIMYWGIANPAPFPGTEDFPNGSSRPGPNLYSNSIVALDSRDGKLIWYNQVKPHDLFDLDFQGSPVLTSAQINGRETEIVIATGKLGKVYAFDRKSGEIYWQTPVGEHQNDDLTTLPTGTTRVSPGPLGGVTSPIAVANGTVYVPVVNVPGDFTPDKFVFETFDMGAGNGELVALDVNTGAPVWNAGFSSVNVGGATVVNDLVFTATLDGMIHALDAKTGEEVWSYQAQGGLNGWPAAAQDFILFPVGLGPSPKLLAFKLGATSPAPSSPSTTTPSETAPPEPAPVAFTADGIISPGEYTHSETYNDYELHWKNDDAYVYLAMKARTTGYVAVGIQPGSMMKDADIILGFIADGKTEVLDLFSTGSFGPHPEDTELGGSDDILEFGGNQDNGYTTIEFKRALKTNDNYDHELVKGENKIIWAYGTSANPDIKHAVRGTGEVIID